MIDSLVEDRGILKKEVSIVLGRFVFWCSSYIEFHESSKTARSSCSFGSRNQIFTWNETTMEGSLTTLTCRDAVNHAFSILYRDDPCYTRTYTSEHPRSSGKFWKTLKITVGSVEIIPALYAVISLRESRPPNLQYGHRSSIIIHSWVLVSSLLAFLATLNGRNTQSFFIIEPACTSNWSLSINAEESWRTQLQSAFIIQEQTWWPSLPRRQPSSNIR